MGYGEGGVLTEACVATHGRSALLDEIEKAHHDVRLFYRVFDKGEMEDGEGTHVDFRTTLLLTTNVGSDLISRMCEDRLMPDATEPKEALMPEYASISSGISGPRDGDPLPAAGRNVAWRDCPSAP